MAGSVTCKHEICVCPVAEDSEYCSDHCQTLASEDMVSIACDCGHPGCEKI